MERLVFLPVSIVVALIAVRFDLTYVGLAVAVGIAIPLLSVLRGRAVENAGNLAYALIGIGLLCLLLAYLVCRHYGISMDALDRDFSFPRRVRNLPYFGIALLTSGAVYMLLAILGKRSS